MLCHVSGWHLREKTGQALTIPHVPVYLGATMSLIISCCVCERMAVRVGDSRTFLRQSHFCETVSLFCDSVDRALEWSIKRYPGVNFAITSVNIMYIDFNYFFTVRTSPSPLSPLSNESFNHIKRIYIYIALYAAKTPVKPTLSVQTVQ